MSLLPLLDNKLLRDSNCVFVFSVATFHGFYSVIRLLIPENVPDLY
jgi:hypothetical protein